MKPLTFKVILVLLFSLSLLNAFGQRQKPKAKKPSKAPADTVLQQVQADQQAVKSLSNTVVANKTKTDSTLSAIDKKAESLKTSLSKVDSTVKADKKPDSSGMGKYLGKPFVFQKPIQLVECDELGRIVLKANQPIIPKGSTFTVENITKNGQLVIAPWIWRLDADIQNGERLSQDTLALKEKIDSLKTSGDEETLFERLDRFTKRDAFNFKAYAYKSYAPLSLKKTNDNRRYFLIGKDTLTDLCAPYKKVKDWDINYGALVTTFKLRFRRFSFSNNLSLGGAIYFQHKMKSDTNFKWGIIGALSLSSVTLDSSTTNLHTKPLLTTSTTRPAFSPSMHYAISYKQIDLTVGIGWDLLSKPSDAAHASATNPEAGWIYNNKPWLGIGLGFNLFTSSSAKGTPSDKTQKVPDK